MQVHIWPSRTRLVAAANAAISVHASCVASWVGTGTVWKWSKTQIDSKGPSSRSASWAMPSMVAQWSLVSMPAKSSRHPCGTKSPKRMAHHPMGGGFAGARRGSSYRPMKWPAGCPAGSWLVLDQGPGLDLEQVAGGEQAGYLHGGAGRGPGGVDDLVAGRAHGGQVGDVEHEDAQLDHVGEGRARFPQAAAEVREHLPRLRLRVAGADQ